MAKLILVPLGFLLLSCSTATKDLASDWIEKANIAKQNQINNYSEQQQSAKDDEQVKNLHHQKSPKL